MIDLLIHLLFHRFAIFSFFPKMFPSIKQCDSKQQVHRVDREFCGQILRWWIVKWRRGLKMVIFFYPTCTYLRNVSPQPCILIFLLFSYVHCTFLYCASFLATYSDIINVQQSSVVSVLSIIIKPTLFRA